MHESRDAAPACIIPTATRVAHTYTHARAPTASFPKHMRALIRLPLTPIIYIYTRVLRRAQTSAIAPKRHPRTRRGFAASDARIPRSKVLSPRVYIPFSSFAPNAKKHKTRVYACGEWRSRKLIKEFRARVR